MKKIEYEIDPCPFLECALPWFLERFAMFVNSVTIGMWEFGIPATYTAIVVDSQKQYKEFFSEYVWETHITFPALGKNLPVMDEKEFLDSPYQAYVYYYDGNFLNVWFKDDTLADLFMEHLKQGTIIYPTKERTTRLTREDSKNFSIWENG